MKVNHTKAIECVAVKTVIIDVTRYGIEIGQLH